MKQTQTSILRRLLLRKCGVTSLEIIKKCGTVAPHRRLADLKEQGMSIWSQRVPGKTYLRYFGKGA